MLPSQQAAPPGCHPGEGASYAPASALSPPAGRTSAGPSSAAAHADQEEDDEDLLEFIMGEDFMQQLMDKFGGPADLAGK